MAEGARKVAVVGGGIAGLSAAYYLQKQARAEGVLLDITLIEAAHRLGGKIQTLRKDGFVIERGPDSFLSRKENMMELAEELGIGGQLLESSSGRGCVMVEDRLHPIPDGSVMGVPTEIGPFLVSDLYSWSGKIRAAGDLVLPKSDTSKDQPLGRFVRRRFGNEVVDNLIEPLFTAIYGGDIDKLSLHATFPAFSDIEQRYGSVIRGMKKSGDFDADEFSANGLGSSQNFKQGMGTIIEALESHLGNCTVLKGVKVEKLEKQNGQTLLSLNNDSAIIVDEVILALPHTRISPLFERYGLLKQLKEMPAASVATVSMAFAAEPHNCLTENAAGFVVARNSDVAITSCAAAHSKWPGHAPEGKMLFKAFIGKVGDETVVDLSDNEIEKTVLADLRKSLNLKGDPEFTVVSRWKEALPQFLVGHHERIEQAKQELNTAFPAIQMIGSSFEGFGLPGCIEQGKLAAQQVIARCPLKHFKAEEAI